VRWLGLAFLVLVGCGPTVVGRTPKNAEIVRIPLQLSNAYLVKTDTPVLIDTGTIGDEHDLAAALADQGLSMRRIALVILTHVHADHAGLATTLQSFGARVVVGEGDAERAGRGVNDELKPTSFTASVLKPLIRGIFPELRPDQTVTEGAPLDLAPWGIDGQVIAMPGHTTGSLVVVMSNHAAFAGDMMRGGPAEHYFHADRARNHQNIATLCNMGIDTFYLGHGGPESRSDVMRVFGIR
jgi:glyoxylase-like metal-dependent hydrolase (beta-lactamase superfamily II)